MLRSLTTVNRCVICYMFLSSLKVTATVTNYTSRNENDSFILLNASQKETSIEKVPNVGEKSNKRIKAGNLLKKLV